MGCNGHNHLPDCDCGWGGDTETYRIALPDLNVLFGLSGAVSIEALLNPNARCPICEDQVYFYRSPDGGSVYFDELGSPWPKHPCMESGPEFRGNLFSFFQANGADMKPDQAIRLAAELVKYAMTDFREPNRAWPNTEVFDARAELLKWLFSQHSSGDDYLVPLDELLQILSYIEKSAQSQIDLNIMGQKLRSSLSGEISEEESRDMQESVTKSMGTLALISQLRAHYNRKSFSTTPTIKAIDGN